MEQQNRNIFDRRESMQVSPNGSSTIGSNNNILNGSNLRKGSGAIAITSKTVRRASMLEPIDPTEIQKTLYKNQVSYLSHLISVIFYNFLITDKSA
jgi:hypothetical protein